MSKSSRSDATSDQARSAIDWPSVHRRLEATSRRLQDQDDLSADPKTLRARAHALAAKPSAIAADPDAKQIFVFGLGGATYALAAEFVRELVESHEPTPLPGTPAYLRGLINLRSRILPAIDLRAFFSVDARKADQTGQWLIIDRAGTQFALWTDEALGLRERVNRELDKAHLAAGSLNPDYIQSVTTEGIVVLDLQALIRDLTLDQNVDL